MEHQPLVRLNRDWVDGRGVECWVNARDIESITPEVSKLPWDGPPVTWIKLKRTSGATRFADHPWIVASAIDWALDTSHFTPELRQSCDDALSGKYGWPWSMNA